MSTSTWTKTIRKVGDDSWDGEHYEVCPDADGLNCVEVRLRKADGTFGDRMTVPPDAALLLAEAMAACARELAAEHSREALT